MAELPVFSSQGSQYDRLQILKDEENLGSSPPKALDDVPAISSQRTKKPPTVTPKRFRKFFTPRASLDARRGRKSKAGRQLRDITRNGANRRRTTIPFQNTALLDKDAIENDDAFARPWKRRKHSFDLESSPPQSSPLKHVQLTEDIKIFEDVPMSPSATDEDDLTDIIEDVEPFPTPIRRLRCSNHNQRIVRRSFGGHEALSRGRRGYDHCVDWQAENSSFVSTPSDTHAFNGTALPFCTTSCNTNSLIAIGEEEGHIRLIDSSTTADFTQTHLAFRPHRNAIMDIAFSSDDYMLATASGDQTARIVDMHTQNTICVLSGHKSSLKQVRFLPDDNNVITTSSRDGGVMIWNLRCGATGPVQSLRTSFARNVDSGGDEPPVRYAKYALDISATHRSTKSGSSRASTSDNANAASVSITAIQHLSSGREHLLLTTSELNSSIKLWDLRNVSRRASTPLSSTPLPDSHGRTRNYGISAMALSGDGGRLYAACRDGSVYAYSSNHLVLGHAPEMSQTGGKGRITKASKMGVGPLYGFQHPALRVGTFYIKASLRPASGDKSEILAVGSSDNCAVLFPTDERHLPAREMSSDDSKDFDDADLPTVPPRLVPTKGVSTHEHGTALIRGHDKEVTSLAWSHDGDLVTVSDDFSARCWREDSEKARELRSCGEGEGRRWGSGWADVDAGWDEEDD